MAIFNSYVSLPEGTALNRCCDQMYFHGLPGRGAADCSVSGARVIWRALFSAAAAKVGNSKVMVPNMDSYR